MSITQMQMLVSIIVITMMIILIIMALIIIIIFISCTSLDSMQAEAGQGQDSGDEGRHCFATFFANLVLQYFLQIVDVQIVQQ